MNPKHYDTEYNRFQIDWRKRYLDALEAKYSFLVKTQAGHSFIDEKATIDNYNRKIEALELEHKIRHEKIVYADWVLRSEQHKTFQANEQSEAEENMQRVLDTANGFLSTLNDQWEDAFARTGQEIVLEQLNVKISRLEHLLTKYEGANKSDADEMVKIYQSLKTALIQFGVKWDIEKTP